MARTDPAILLSFDVEEFDAPLAYGIYVFMQSAAGRGAGAALGVIAVIFVAICTYLSHVLVERSQRSRGLGQ